MYFSICPSPPILFMYSKSMGMSLSTFRLWDCSATDQELMELARQTDRIIITADLDFPQLLALSGAAAPGIILFRGGDYSELEMEELLRRVLDSILTDRIQRAICVVDRKRIRCHRIAFGQQLISEHLHHRKICIIC